MTTREPGEDDDDETPPTWLPELLRRDRARESLVNVGDGNRNAGDTDGPSVRE